MYWLCYITILKYLTLKKKGEKMAVASFTWGSKCQRVKSMVASPHVVWVGHQGRGSPSAHFRQEAERK